MRCAPHSNGDRFECCASQLTDALCDMRQLSSLVLEFKQRDIRYAGDGSVASYERWQEVHSRMRKQKPVHCWPLVLVIHAGSMLPSLRELSITHASLHPAHGLSGRLPVHLRSQGLRSYLLKKRQAALAGLARHGLTSLTLEKCAIEPQQELQPHGLVHLALRSCKLDRASQAQVRSRVQHSKHGDRCLTLPSLDLGGNCQLGLQDVQEWRLWVRARSAAVFKTLRRVILPTGASLRIVGGFQPFLVGGHIVLCWRCGRHCLRSSWTLHVNGRLCQCTSVHCDYVRGRSFIFAGKFLGNCFKRSWHRQRAKQGSRQASHPGGRTSRHGLSAAVAASLALGRLLCAA